MSERPKRIIADSPHGLVSFLNEEVDDIAEIYCVIRTKDGTFSPQIIGNAAGLAFAILVLQQYALDCMREQR